MERLPYIDTPSTLVPAPPEAVWAALVRAVGRLGGERTPRALSRLLATEPAVRRGGWDTGQPRPGDTVPGFAVREVLPHRRLGLAGGHRFSRYTLAFTLESAAGGTRLAARTDAAFPGVLGRGYRLLVISSGAHGVLVRRLLRTVGAAAAATSARPGQDAGSIG